MSNCIGPIHSNPGERLSELRGKTLISWGFQAILELSQLR
jgi:hypothetical protein